MQYPLINCRGSYDDTCECGCQDEPSQDDLLEAAKLGAKWMSWWLSQDECECEYGHTCGKNERRRELDQIEAAIKANDH